jgi:hypothetical protein
MRAMNAMSGRAAGIRATTSMSTSTEAFEREREEVEQEVDAFSEIRMHVDIAPSAANRPSRALAITSRFG